MSSPSKIMLQGAVFWLVLLSALGLIYKAYALITETPVEATIHTAVWVFTVTAVIALTGLVIDLIRNPT